MFVQYPILMKFVKWRWIWGIVPDKHFFREYSTVLKRPNLISMYVHSSRSFPLARVWIQASLGSTNKLTGKKRFLNSFWNSFFTSPLPLNSEQWHSLHHFFFVLSLFKKRSLGCEYFELCIYLKPILPIFFLHLANKLTFYSIKLSSKLMHELCFTN